MKSCMFVDKAQVIAELMFAYMNKDADQPHQFEIDAFKRGLAVLEKSEEIDPDLLKRYQEIASRMEMAAHRGIGD